MTLVAISAAYGAAGSRIGPLLAQRLGVPFVDRGIALAVAERLEVSLDEALAYEEAPEAPSLLERLLAGFAGTDVSGAPAPVYGGGVNAEDFHRAMREALRAQADRGSGVILGRGAVGGLRDDPRVLRVRLTGPAQRRVAQAMRLGDLDRETAERALRRMDRAQAEYLRRFYDLDIDDVALYHLTIDATAFSPALCVDLIAQAMDELSSVAARG